MAEAARPAPTGLVDRLRSNGDVALAVGVLGLIMIMLAPLPPFVLDLLLVLSLGSSLLLFFTTLAVRRAVEFSLFPSVLLVTTLFRLGLNVASTRLILLTGHEGTSAAGQIIEAFGQFVVGGSFAVGFVLFVILVVINFVVITKGAGRVAEVAARFTLDALPGKQMAVDAELNAGLIDEPTAKKRRAEITREADFYGSMDGASKFVKGDAVAGIVITLINVLGGMFIGIAQHDLDVWTAAETYTILTIGDGLVGQVPALIVSTAAGLLVTRVDDAEAGHLHDRLGSQLFTQPRVLAMCAGALGVMALIPGLTLPFLVVAAGFGALAWYRWRVAQSPTPTEEPLQAPAAAPTPDDLLPVQQLALEIGADLIYLVSDDAKRDGVVATPTPGGLMDRIQKARNQFATELGVVLPVVHLRDNMSLPNGEYRFFLREEVVGSGVLEKRRVLALDPGGATGKLKGIPTRDPVFGMDAWWIHENQESQAKQLGYALADLPTVLITHFTELMTTHAHELYDLGQLQKALDRVAEKTPKLVEDLIPDVLPRATVLRVFRNLLREGVSVRDAQTVLESLADFAHKTRDPDVLTEFVRQRLARHITRRLADRDGKVAYVALGRNAEGALLRGLQTTEGGAPNLVVDPDVAQQLFTQIKRLTEGHAGEKPAVVLAPPLVRGALRRMVERVLPRAVVVSSAELLPTVTLDRVGVVEVRAGAPAT